MRPVEPGDLEALVQFGRQYEDAETARRLRAYALEPYPGFVAFEGGQLAGYFWWVDHTYTQHPHLIRRPAALAPGDAYGWDFYLAPPFRGLGRGLEFLSAIMEWLSEREYVRIWGIVPAWNLTAQRVYFRVGGKVIVQSSWCRILTTFLVSEGALHIRNFRWNKQTFDYRPLVVFRRRQRSRAAQADGA